MHPLQGVCTQRLGTGLKERYRARRSLQTMYECTLSKGCDARPAFMLPRPSCPSSSVIIANKAWYVLKIDAHIVTRKAPDGSAVEIARLIPNRFLLACSLPLRARLSLRLQVAVDIFDLLVPSSIRILNCP